MFILPREIKQNPVHRWNLTDRVFFACGACHILTYAFLKTHPDAGFRAVWITPLPGFTGNHIVAVRDDVAIDYHGYTSWSALLEHTKTKARRRWTDWDCELTELPPDVLIDGPKSRTYDGLWLREPKQFLHDAMPRAEAFVSRYPSPARNN